MTLAYPFPGIQVPPYNENPVVDPALFPHRVVNCVSGMRSHQK
jgi:hypothetical protein